MDDTMLKTIPMLLFIICLSTILNSLGIYLLHKDGSRQTNQNLILKFLSTNEVFLSVILMIKWSMTMNGFTQEDKHLRILYVIFTYMAMNNYFIMLFMSFDRLIAVKYPLRYATLLSKKRAMTILFTALASCAIFGLISIFLNYKAYYPILTRIIAPAISLFATVCILITYIYIFLKIWRQANRTASMQDGTVGSINKVNNRRRNTESQRFLKMAAIITFTFVVCFLVPDIIYAFHIEDMTDSEVTNMYAVWCAGLVIDPITYILMQKRMRGLLKTVLCFKKQQQQQFASSRGELATKNSAIGQAVFDTRL